MCGSLSNNPMEVFMTRSFFKNTLLVSSALALAALLAGCTPYHMVKGVTSMVPSEKEAQLNEDSGTQDRVALTSIKKIATFDAEAAQVLKESGLFKEVVYIEDVEFLTPKQAVRVAQKNGADAFFLYKAADASSVQQWSGEYKIYGTREASILIPPNGKRVYFNIASYGQKNVWNKLEKAAPDGAETQRELANAIVNDIRNGRNTQYGTLE